MPRGVYERKYVAPAQHLPEAKQSAQSFLRAFLSGGPILRTNVYRESEDKGYQWEEVKTAFHEIQGREYVQRGEWFWRWVG